MAVSTLEPRKNYLKLFHAFEIAKRITSQPMQLLIVANPGWGEALFLKEVWPDAKLILLVEYWYNFRGGDVGFDPEFLAPQAGHAPPCAVQRDPGAVRAELGATGGEELADLGLVVHGVDGRPAPARERGPARTLMAPPWRAAARAGYVRRAGRARPLPARP